MADNPLRSYSFNELRELDNLRKAGQLTDQAIRDLGLDPSSFNANIRVALEEKRSGPGGRDEPPSIRVPASRISEPENIAPRDLGQAIARSILPTPELPPAQGFGEERRRPLSGPSVDFLRSTEEGPPQVGQPAYPQVTPPAAAPDRVDPLGAVRNYLGNPMPGGGMPGPTKFTMPTRPADINEEDARRKLLAGLPAEREAQETYKADPYMTMLQTGLRILSAKPELGQNAISTIAGPVAEGTEKYMAEKEKERTSKREEAKEAREESYRRFGAQREVSSKLLDLGEAAKNRDIQFQNLRNQVERGISEDAYKRAELGIRGSEAAMRRAELEIKLLAEQGKIPQREAFEITQRLENQALAIERIPEEQRTQEQNAQLESLRRQQAAVMRATGAYVTGEFRQRAAAGPADAAQARALQVQAETIRRRMLDIQNSYKNAADPEGFRRDPEYLRYLAELERLNLGGETQPPNMNLAPPRPSR